EDERDENEKAGVASTLFSEDEDNEEMCYHSLSETDVEDSLSGSDYFDADESPIMADDEEEENEYECMSVASGALSPEKTMVNNQTTYSTHRSHQHGKRRASLPPQSGTATKKSKSNTRRDTEKKRLKNNAYMREYMRKRAAKKREEEAQKRGQPLDVPSAASERRV
ncbi:hypothetical protein PENTCL1PPCAC_23669, partial [Pristionchus entomophagus]